MEEAGLILCENYHSYTQEVRGKIAADPIAPLSDNQEAVKQSNPCKHHKVR